MMKISSLILMTFAFGLAGAFAQTSADDPKVAAIREAYKKANELISEMERSPEYSSIFITELVVNKHNAPYPAVGIYGSNVHFYYTYGDREKNPFPDRLIKATVITRRSAETEYSEYLFSAAGELLFSFVKEATIERRGYFDKGRLIRFQNGEKLVPVREAIATGSAGSMIAEAKRIRRLFANSL